jgi:uncharacterized protein with PIN domain
LDLFLAVGQPYTYTPNLPKYRMTSRKYKDICNKCKSKMIEVLHSEDMKNVSYTKAWFCPYCHNYIKEEKDEPVRN